MRLREVKHRGGRAGDIETRDGFRRRTGSSRRETQRIGPQRYDDERTKRSWDGETFVKASEAKVLSRSIQDKVRRTASRQA